METVALVSAGWSAAGTSAATAVGATAGATTAFQTGVSLGTAATYAGYAGTAMSLLGTYQSYQQQKYQGELAALQGQDKAYQYRMQSEQAQLKANEDSILRRERLLKALAAQSAMQGASGLGGGTAESLRLESLDQYGKEQQSADYMTQATRGQYAVNAMAAQRTGQIQQSTYNAQARSSLLSGAMKLASIG